LPAPTFNISQLQQSFSQRGLSLQDLVALSGTLFFTFHHLVCISFATKTNKLYAGGHTLGFAHCSSFQNRIHKFSSKQSIDPSLNPSFANTLQSKCHVNNKVKNAGSPLDSSATYFDNAYYKLLLQGESILSSDQALLTHPTTKALVSKYAHSQMEFERAFVKSMIKMSSITNGGQEIRLQCNLVR
jgi:peroxidase